MIRRALPLAAALLLTGCNGGTVDRHDLTKDAGTLDSIACEGALVADGVARGRTWAFYAREQAEELRVQTSNLAHALAVRKTVPGLDRRVHQAQVRRDGMVRPGLVTGRIAQRSRPLAASAATQRSLR